MHTSVDVCHDTLRRRILAGDYPVGERLPPERRLAEELGVGRPTVRSALAQLAAQGLVSARQGSGYVVHDFLESGGPDLLPGLAALAVDDGSFPAVARDLLAVRRHLANAVLERLAADPPTATDQLAVATAIDAFAAAVASGPTDTAELARLDLAIVAALLRATRSPVLGLCLHPVARTLQDLPALRDAIYAAPEGNVLGWRALQAWLTAPSADSLPTVSALLAERDAVTLVALSAIPSPTPDAP